MTAVVLDNDMVTRFSLDAAKSVVQLAKRINWVNEIERGINRTAMVKFVDRVVQSKTYATVQNVLLTAPRAARSGVLKAYAKATGGKDARSVLRRIDAAAHRSQKRVGKVHMQRHFIWF